MELAPAGTSGDSVEEEVLAQIVRQKGHIPIRMLAVALVMAAMAWPTVPSWALALWLAWIVAVLVMRDRFYTRHALDRGIPLAARLHRAVMLSGLNGVGFALSLLFFPYLGPYERVMLTLLLLGLCTVSVAITAGYRPVHVVFMLPVVASLSVAWATSGLLGAAPWLEVSVAVFVALSGGLLVGQARNTQRLFVESFDMRKQHAEMNDRLRQALQQAEAANSAKTRFLASASHDLRQPLHTLSLFTEALWLRPLDPTTREIAAHMREALLGLGTQLDGLLDISKLDAQLVEARLAPVDLGVVLHRLHQQYAPEAARRKLDWRVEAPQHVLGETDPLLFERILRNLIDNAFKYTQTGQIVLGVVAAGERLVVSVADSGCGIPAAEQERVFEEFYQVGNPERSRAQGLGLGLSIVKRLAGLLHIDLTLTSTPAVGTTVQLSLLAARSGAAPNAVDAPAAAIAGLHVLVIDDEEQVRLAMRALLAELGCTCDLASSSDEAVAAAQRTRPSIVIADFRLRGADNGIDAVRRLRQAIAGLPALLLSGDTAPSRLAEAEAAGIELLHKPVTIDPLLRAIAQQLKREELHGHRELA